MLHNWSQFSFFPLLSPLPPLVPTQCRGRLISVNLHARFWDDNSCVWGRPVPEAAHWCCPHSAGQKCEKRGKNPRVQLWGAYDKGGVKGYEAADTLNLIIWGVRWVFTKMIKSWSWEKGNTMRKFKKKATRVWKVLFLSSSVLPRK